ncbi:hypothetical protein [Actinocrispum sp. NPDC049592]|uniref:hypothetical protein n=1 Tax=Actinocrispum sp. NPDC049592 TaxID=3154835 RepID=UPI0034305CD2
MLKALDRKLIEYGEHLDLGGADPIGEVGDGEERAVLVSRADMRPSALWVSAVSPVQ